MKLALQELNEHAWYRGLKVVYVVSYLAFFAVGLLFVVDASRHHVPSRLPSSAAEAFQDDNFYMLSSAEMISALTAIDADFGGLPESEKQKAITEIKQYKSKYSKGKANFTYYARTDVNIPRAILLVVLCIVATIAVMEFIRRCFYYIAIGQLFPKKMG
jgi:hypothetical protein